MNARLFNRDTYELTRQQERAVLRDRINTAIDRGDVGVYRAYLAIPYEGTQDIGIFSTYDEALKALKRDVRTRGYAGTDYGFYVEAVVVNYPELRQDWTEVQVGRTKKGNRSLKTVSLI